MLLVRRQEGHPACKNWAVRYWCGYLSAARCKWFAYGPADATATPSSLASLQSRMVYLSHAGLPRSMFPQYTELRPTSGWDRSGSLGHRCKFQRVSRLGSVTARHCSSGRESNFATLNRGRHLYSAGRPSRWAMAHISSCQCYHCAANVSAYSIKMFTIN